MGILDATLNNWGQWSQDPNQNRANDAYLNALAAGLLAGKSNNFGVNLGGAMSHAQSARGDELDRIMKGQLAQAQMGNFASESELRKAQISEMQRRAQQDEDNRRAMAAILSPQPNTFDFKKSSGAVNAGFPNVQGPPPSAPGLHSLDQVQQLAARGLYNEQLQKLWENQQPKEVKPMERDPRTGAVNQNLEAKSGLRWNNQTQSVEPIPGFAEAQARAAGLVKQAETSVTEPTNVVTIPGAGPNGAPVTMTQSALRAQQQPTFPLSGTRDMPMNLAPDHMDMIYAEAKRLGIRPDVAFRLFAQESNGNPNAVSPKGATGLGQLMPSTAQEMGVTDPRNPQQNITGSLGYLKKQLDASGGDYAKALAAYNAGPGRAARPGPLPAETVNYQQRIMGGPGGIFPGADPIGTEANKLATTDYMKSLGESKDKTLAATQSLRQISDMDAAIQQAKAEGKILTGPTTGWRETALATAKTFGIGGKDADAWLAQRAQLVQSAANMALNGAAATKGQGQISNYERDMIKQASSPEIDKMTYSQMQAALSGIAKAHIWQVEQHQRTLGKAPSSLTAENRAMYEVQTDPEMMGIAKRLMGNASEQPQPATSSPAAMGSVDYRQKAIDALNRMNQQSPSRGYATGGR